MTPISWNDVLTVSAFLISLAVAAYQIKDYRARPPKPMITAVREPGFRSKPDGERRHARFELYGTIENRGRNTFTVSQVVLEPEIGDTIELHSLEHNNGEHTFPGNTPREISYTGDTELPDDHPDEVDGTVRIETPAGDDEITTTFELIERR